jgi:ATP-dependent helicase/nuclease subunit B
MLHPPLLISPGPGFWDGVAQAICEGGREDNRFLSAGRAAPDLSALRVVVPGVAHIQPLRRALTARMPPTFVPPRIGTLSAWLALRAAIPTCCRSRKPWSRCSTN